MNIYCSLTILVPLILDVLSRLAGPQPVPRLLALMTPVLPTEQILASTVIVMVPAGWATPAMQAPVPL